ncbi:MAG: hypothetical protein M3Y87_29555 [Myxococcota bacterium]|nr:hypothetical protein [Myxococcota bacterium]
MSRPRLSALRALALASLLFTALTSRALAQDAQPAEGGGTTGIEREEAGRSRGGYAWGETGGEGGESGPEYHRFGHVFASLGAGGTVRILAHADQCNPETPGRESCRFSPPYLQLRGGWLFEGDGAIQHGVGLGIATNLTSEGTTVVEPGLDALAQWTLTPTYFFRYWFDSWFQLMAHFGVPLAIGNVTYERGGTVISSVDFNWGLELQLGLVFKPITGLGVYAAASVATYFAGSSSVWPTISFEGGLVFDYEVLP